MVLKTLIQKLGLVKPVMIGPSMGGRIALECAIRWPELLGGLVLVGAVGVRENEAELATIKVPTLIVRGGNDQISPLINSEILNRSIAGSRKVIIDDTAHPCYVEDPDSWHALLLDFMVTEFIGKRVLKQVAGPSEPQAWSLFRTPA